MSAPADPPPAEPDPADPPPGLAAERTALAWTRTALAYAVCVLLGARLARSDPTLFAVAGTGAVATAALALAGARRYRQARADGASGGPVAEPGAVAMAAALTVLLAAVAALLICLG